MLYKILVVCTGNICRSPTGEAALKHIIAQDSDISQNFYIDSCGISSFHVGERPDSRSVQVGEARGISFKGQRARQIAAEDFYEFDLILAMDEGHLANLQSLAPRDKNAELALYLEYAGCLEREVGDPYYGGNKGFIKVFDLIMEGAEKIITKLKNQ